MKTDPVGGGWFAWLDLPGHVFAADPATQGRPDAPYWSLVENPRLQRGRGVQRRVLDWGEISPSQAAAWRKSIDVFDEQARHPRTPALCAEDRCAAVTPDGSIVPLRLSEMRLCRPRQWRACWRAGQLWEERQLDRVWSARLPVNRKATRWDQVLAGLVS